MKKNDVISDSYSQEFKDQLSSKVLNRIEKRYSRDGQLSEIELTVYQSTQQAHQLAQLEKIMTASVLFTCGLIVSRLPLQIQSMDQLAKMPYHQRKQMLMLGRFAKVSAYTLLAVSYFMRHRSLDKVVTDEVFDACVAKPIKEGSATLSPCFYKRTQVDAMYRAFLLKTTQLSKDTEALKKYKYDPQSYH